MMPLSTEQLDQLLREELLELLKRLLPPVAEVERLCQRVEELEVEIERLKNRSANSRNSSQPPSRDQKADQPPKKKRKKHGPPFGHPNYSHPLLENPDRVIIVSVEQCQYCVTDLKEVEPIGIKRRQITVLPQAKLVVLETWQHNTICPHCQMLNCGALPEDLEAERYFGQNLEAGVIRLLRQCRGLLNLRDSQFLGIATPLLFHWNI
jgi:transposase